MSSVCGAAMASGRQLGWAAATSMSLHTQSRAMGPRPHTLLLPLSDTGISLPPPRQLSAQHAVTAQQRRSLAEPVGICINLAAWSGEHVCERRRYTYTNISDCSRSTV